MYVPSQSFTYGPDGTLPTSSTVGRSRFLAGVTTTNASMQLALPYNVPDYSTVPRLADMAPATPIHGPSLQLSLCATGVTTCRINFNFTDIIHLVCKIHDTGNGLCSSLDMCIMTELLIFIRPSLDGTYYGMALSVRPSVRPFVRPSDC